MLIYDFICYHGDFRLFRDFAASVLDQYSTIGSGMEKVVGNFNVVS